MVVQTLTLLASHLLSPHKLIASIFTIIAMMIVNFSVGGYSVHPDNVPDFMEFVKYASPQKWLTPVLTIDEFSEESIANAGGMQMCRSKQVNLISFHQIIRN